MDDREVAIAAAKKRMAAFRLRQGSPAVMSTDVDLPVKHHVCSHSRNNSITNAPLSASTLHNAPSIDESLDTSVSVPNSPSPRSRPNSHHRRRSSVSTRRESAEIMGVPPPPETSSDITSDPAELRRLALWALEGKTRVDNSFISGFTKVEIPELNTPEAEGNLDAPQPTKLTPTLSIFGMGSSLAGKRDSFGKLLMSSSNSLKDQLHTLMEEEEEDEEEELKTGERQEEKIENRQDVAVPSTKPSQPFQIELKVHSELPSQDTVSRPLGSTPTRLRPNLILRPLSLTPESLPISRSEGLLTPSPTPSPRIGSGLKTLTLASSPSPVPSNSSSSSSSSGSSASRRQSLSVSPSPHSSDHVERRASLGPATDPTVPIPIRRSSISYKPASAGDSTGYLPTPGPTPTSTTRPSLATGLPTIHSASSVSCTTTELVRPLSPTEQAFLFRSHTSLLCRISDLEKAIADGRGRLPPGAGVPSARLSMETLPGHASHERLSSVTSAGSETSTTESESAPSDEMLQLVADLKAERDELMRDATDWRTRVADLERQISMLTRRVEAERREGWVVRERLGVVEVEKKRICEEAERTRLECHRLERTLQAETEARRRAEEARDAECSRRGEAEREVEALRSEVAALCARVEQADEDLQAILVTPKVDVRMQMPVVRRLNSMDSGTSGSSTDVEEYIPLGLRTRKLNAVEEEEEERDLPRDVTSEGGCGSEIDDEDELMHYEDDDGLEDDLVFSDDQTSTSFGSIVRSHSHLIRLDLAAGTPPAVPSQAHAKKGSMERGWSFPMQPGPAKRVTPKADRFFECLDALDESDVEPEGELPTYDSTTAKQLWRAAAQANEEDEEMPPFILPAQPSTLRREKEWKEIEAAKLEAVLEGEEEEEGMGESSLLNSPVAGQARLDTPVDLAMSVPVTPCSGNPPTPTGIPMKRHQVRRTSKDLTIPGFKPYSGSVPVLKAPPPAKHATSAIVVSNTPTKEVELRSKQASPTQIPRPSRTFPSSPLTTPPKPRASLSGPTFASRVSTSPKLSPSTSTPIKCSNTPAAMKISTPKRAIKTVTPVTNPVFIPQPKLFVTRSSTVLPSAGPYVLTRFAIPQPNVASRAESLTAKLSQQVQSFTSLWSPWSSSERVLSERAVDYPRRWYVNKDRQLEQLRMRLQKEGVPCVLCACCKDGMIKI